MEFIGILCSHLEEKEASSPLSMKSVKKVFYLLASVSQIQHVTVNRTTQNWKITEEI